MVPQFFYFFFFNANITKIMEQELMHVLSHLNLNDLDLSVYNVEFYFVPYITFCDQLVSGRQPHFYRKYTVIVSHKLNDTIKSEYNIMLEEEPAKK